MGRDNTIPRRFFGVLEPKRAIPRNNVLFTGTLALAGAFTMSYQLGAELLNFGAFIAFMGVNAAAFVRYFMRAPQKKLRYWLPPVLGFLICGYIWLSLRTPAKILGGLWLAAGILYGAWKTGGFRRPVEFTIPEE
jgi:putrescine importer